MLFKKKNSAIPLKPALYTEKIILTSILDNIYPPGSVLPNEKELSDEIGVTRTTLRETLQRLSAQGWITIRHGKSTVVNNYLQTGGLKILSTAVKHANNLPEKLIIDLLEFRYGVMPNIVSLAVTNAPDVVLNYLKKASILKNDAKSYTDYDWGLQQMFVTNSGNSVYSFIFNDFTFLFKILAMEYFDLQKSRDASSDYYQKLYHAIKHNGEEIEEIVKKAMNDSIEIWKGLKDE